MRSCALDHLRMISHRITVTRPQRFAGWTGRTPAQVQSGGLGESR
jgi:hypothetical protein